MSANYNKKLRPLASNLRNASTLGEVILWKEVLKDKKFYGYQFNRQFAIGNYIVDFICRKLKLIIEVDGASHQYKSEQDSKRDNELRLLGFRVLRLRESEVKHDLPNVVRALESFLPGNS
ncbi:endonuclease domain-containing protein [Cesiribacter andamanensis]|uniref:endonuclease domain-containing protein n=1 Tax=Cesiribacter andamanensis TaxID=649507 RepID=UPI00058CAA71|nr:endonuclease domain-containing protein [Cesiribacter andamanensis]